MEGAQGRDAGTEMPSQPYTNIGEDPGRARVIGVPMGPRRPEMTSLEIDEDYFYQRAETELELAQKATHPAAVRAHYIIANHYLDRAYSQPDAGAAVEAAE